MRTVAVKARFRVEGLARPGGAARLESALLQEPGVVRVRFDAIPPAAAPASAGALTVFYRPDATTPEQVARAIRAAGFPGVVHL